MKVNTRTEFASLLCKLGLTGYAAEVGVAEGYFSFYLLDHWPGTCYLIDPWAVQDAPGYSVHGDHDQEARYQRVLKVSERYQGRAQLIRKISSDAVLHFRDQDLDFVYIDANHTLESTREDIRLWWPKVKPGGILAGHDYLAGEYAGVNYGVKTAVDEFVSLNRFMLRTTGEKDWPSWWVMKP